MLDRLKILDMTIALPPKGFAICVDCFFSFLRLRQQITGVMTQGRGDGIEWVTSFMVSYSMDAFHWQYVSDQYGNQRVRT